MTLKQRREPNFGCPYCFAVSIYCVSQPCSLWKLKAHMLASGLPGIFIGVAIYVIAMLDYPFSGSVRIDPVEYIEKFFPGGRLLFRGLTCLNHLYRHNGQHIDLGFPLEMVFVFLQACIPRDFS